jgi:hypothetical protein
MLSKQFHPHIYFAKNGEYKLRVAKAILKVPALVHYDRPSRFFPVAEFREEMVQSLSQVLTWEVFKFVYELWLDGLGVRERNQHASDYSDGQYPHRRHVQGRSYGVKKVV